MIKFYFSMVMAAFFLNCAGNITHFYNRDGWSYSQTEKLFQNVLVLTDQAMITDKVKPRVPKNRKLMGVAKVRVRVDENGLVQAVMIQKGIAGLSRELVRAAKLSEYEKYKTALGKTRYYVLIVEYRF